MFYILQKNKLKLSTFEVTNPFETKRNHHHDVYSRFVVCTYEILHLLTFFVNISISSDEQLKFKVSGLMAVAADKTIKS